MAAGCNDEVTQEVPSQDVSSNMRVSNALHVPAASGHRETP